MNEHPSEMERLRALLDGLADLPQELEPERDLWPGISARITPVSSRPRRLRMRRILFQAAAALALFAGGVLVGRSSVEPPRPALRPDPLRAAAEVQRRGSEYVAALASLTAEHGRPGDPVLDQGREAALATLYGAAYELDKLPSEDLSQVLYAVNATRQRGPAVPTRKTSGTRTVPF